MIYHYKILIGVNDCYLTSGGQFFSYIMVKIADYLMIIMLMMYVFILDQQAEWDCSYATSLKLQYKVRHITQLGYITRIPSQSIYVLAC